MTLGIYHWNPSVALRQKSANPDRPHLLLPRFRRHPCRCSSVIGIHGSCVVDVLEGSMPYYDLLPTASTIKS